MKKYFEYTDAVSNKFWEINLKGKQVFVTYGRIGIDSPATKEIKIKNKPFKSKEEAKACVEEKIREKINKGYIKK